MKEEMESNKFDNFNFKKEFDLGISHKEKRKSECLKIMEKYKNRIPVIIVQLQDETGEKLPNLEQTK